MQFIPVLAFFRSGCNQPNLSTFQNVCKIRKIFSRKVISFINNVLNYFRMSAVENRTLNLSS